MQVSDQLHNTTTSVIVNVVDDNDNAPVFARSSYEVSSAHDAFALYDRAILDAHSLCSS